MLVNEIWACDAERLLAMLPENSVGLVIADCHLDMDWVKFLDKILVPSGFVLQSINRGLRAICLLNFISWQIGIIGCFRDICDPVPDRAWMILQRYPNSMDFIGMTTIESVRKMPEACRIHEAQLSTSVFAFLVDKFSHRNLYVVDICAGSGSVAVACAKVGRFYMGCDADLTMVGKANNRLFGRHYK